MNRDRFDDRYNDPIEYRNPVEKGNTPGREDPTSIVEMDDFEPLDEMNDDREGMVDDLDPREMANIEGSTLDDSEQEILDDER